MRWKLVVIVLLVFAAIVQIRSGASSAAREELKWSAGFGWLQSAECARTTGKILVICAEDGSVRPFADFHAGDDPGHALALGIYAAVTGNKAVPSDIATVNAIINGIGIVLLALLLLRIQLTATSIALLVLGPLASNQYQWLGPHTAQFGGTCLAMIPALVILAAGVQKLGRGWFVIAFISLALASVFRQSIGLMGLVAGVVAIAVQAATHSRSVQRIALSCASFAVLVIAYKVPGILLSARDFAYQLAPSTRMETHGAWHSLFIGLGAVQNPFGIAWDDMSGFRHAQAIDPTVQYTSKHYYDVLRGAYFDIVLHHPFIVARIYAEKLAYAIARGGVWIMLLVTVYPAFAFRNRLTIPVLIVSGLFVCFFLGQASLIYFGTEYRFPIVISFILMLGAAIDGALDRRSSLSTSAGAVGSAQ